MSFKKTEVGNIPCDWNVDIIDNIKSNNKNAIAMGPFGSNIKKENFVNVGVPVIRGNNLNGIKLIEEDFVFLTEEKADTLKASLVKKCDIIITHRGTLGQVSIVPQNSKYDKYIVSQSGMKLTCDNEKVDPYFINYFLNSRIGQYLLLRNKSQVGVPSIASPTTSLKKIPLPIPKLKEQKAIVKILSDLDKKIEVNNQINDNLEKMAQAIFKQWFVDFEFPNEDGEPYKSSGGEMVESELGMIPLKWKIKKIQNIIDNVKNNTKPGEHLNCRKYVPIDTMPMKTLVSNDFKSSEEANSSLILFDKFDILIGAMRVYFHRVNLAAFNGVTRTTTFVLRSKKATDISYNLLLLNMDETINYASNTSKGSTMPYAVWENGLGDMSIAYPEESLRIKFNSIVLPLLENIIKNNNEIINLKNIRDLLLPKLMSGEIRVPLKED